MKIVPLAAISSIAGVLANGLLYAFRHKAVNSSVRLIKILGFDKDKLLLPA